MYIFPVPKFYASQLVVLFCLISYNIKYVNRALANLNYGKYPIVPFFHVSRFRGNYHGHFGTLKKLV